MKRIIPFAIILITLTSCATHQTQGMPVSIATDLPHANMPNPASVYCEQNGNTLEIVTAGDGSQSGRCVFPDGSSCDEWVYYRGECGPATPAVTVEETANPSNNPGSFVSPGTAEEIANWWGVIKGTESGAQYDDYFERQDLGQIIRFGIDSMDPSVKSQIEALRDSGRVIHIYGTVVSNVADYNGSQILVHRLEVE